MNEPSAGIKKKWPGSISFFKIFTVLSNTHASFEFPATLLAEATSGFSIKRLFLICFVSTSEKLCPPETSLVLTQMMKL